MNSKSKLLILSVLSVWALASCDSKDSPNPDVVKETKGKIENLSQSTLDIPAGGEVETITFSSNLEWSAKTSDSWISVSPSSGNAGSASITITVKENSSYETRNGSVTITAGTATASISIGQHAAVKPSIDQLSATSVSFEADGGQSAISFTSTLSWQASTAHSWASISPTSGNSGSVMISVSVSANTSTEARSTTLTLSSGSVAVRIDVLQKGRAQDAVSDPNPSTLRFEARGGEDNVVFTTNTAWQASCEESWVNLKPASGEAGTITLTVMGSENTAYEPRSAVVTITAGTASVKIPVNQEAAAKPEITLKSSNLHEEGMVFGSGNSSYLVEFSASGEWHIASEISWLYADTSSGDASDNVSVWFYANRNASTSARTGTISLICGSTTINLKATQKGIPEQTTPNDPTYGNSGEPGGSTGGGQTVDL